METSELGDLSPKSPEPSGFFGLKKGSCAVLAQKNDFFSSTPAGKEKSKQLHSIK